MPQSVIDAEIDGAVAIAIRVDETGTPTKTVLRSGPMWPCGTRPIEALEELSSTLADMAMNLRFSPAIKDGKPISKDISLTIGLKNPIFNSEPVEIDTATGKPKARYITSGVLNGKAKSLPRPAYPPEAKANRASGSVAIQVLVDEEGKVIRAGAVSGAPTLQYAAREAACGAKFEPTTTEGESDQDFGRYYLQLCALTSCM